MNKANPNEAVLVRVPAHMYEDFNQVIFSAGYNLIGDGNYQRLTAVPNFLRKDYERPSERLDQ